MSWEYIQKNTTLNNSFVGETLRHKRNHESKSFQPITWLTHRLSFHVAVLQASLENVFTTTIFLPIVDLVVT